MAGNDVKAKDSEKFALFKKIQDSKLLLFGKFSETVTKQAKDVKWEAIRQELIAEGHSGFESKTAKQLRIKCGALQRLEQLPSWMRPRRPEVEELLSFPRKSNFCSWLNSRFFKIEKLVLAIVDAESLQVSDMDVAETGEDASASEQDNLRSLTEFFSPRPSISALFMLR
uniref:Regulatory protein zeste n=1 Tax=Ditylenchus dipsaci TaxID=166011 RepID=A0A915EEI2_9BILA